MNKDMNNNIAIEFRNVIKEYKLYKNEKQRLYATFSKGVKPIIKRAINDVNFRIKKGESVALFGRNGAGKSTLLKMITGVIFPTKGKVIVNGRVSALLELTAGFDPEFTGRENIYFRGQLLGMKEVEIRELEEDIVEFADIGPYIDQPVRTYSSGMKARLGFAINVNVKPEIIIVDEALSVGDKAFRNKCNNKINEIVDQGVTFLFVTHSTAVAKSFCKRAIYLKNGQEILDGEINGVAEFYEESIRKELEEKRREIEEKRKASQSISVKYELAPKSVRYPEYVLGQAVRLPSIFVRKGPGTDHEVLFEMPINTEVKIWGYDRAIDGRIWNYIQLGDQNGYVVNRFAIPYRDKYEESMHGVIKTETELRVEMFLESYTLVDLPAGEYVEVKEKYKLENGDVYKVMYKNKYIGFVSASDIEINSI